MYKIVKQLQNNSDIKGGLTPYESSPFYVALGTVGNFIVFLYN